MYDRYSIQSPVNKSSTVSKTPQKLYTAGEKDGKLYVSGAFYIYADGAHTLAEVLQVVKETHKAYVEPFIFYTEGLMDGWSHEALMTVMHKGFEEAYGAEEMAEVWTKLEEVKDDLAETARRTIERAMHPENEAPFGESEKVATKVAI